ncbi:MAG TPA: adenosine kinase [Acidimicrobiaceae bacterium]|nr:adenosine kinase [Acidimicrobiaceae bacterium]|tara:strand:+ start:53 stop:1051 length:999 start_codon:yes stop_codon:yes gene_type:complete
MAASKSELDLDVVGFGNALVDVLSHQEDDFINQIGSTKGAMNLVDAERSAELYDLIEERVTVSGGSAANTVIGVKSFGGSCGYVGRVATDDLGDVFSSDMTQLGIEHTTPRAPTDDPTGRCIVFITPDGERTLNTFLGASNGLTPADVDLELIARAKLLFLEGYLWDPPEAKAAMRYAASAISDGAQVALTLSDQFCVERHRPSFLDLIDDHVDVLFANHHEVMSLFEVDRIELALDLIQERVDLAAITMGADGSVLITPDGRTSIGADPVARVVDKTGAGDLYASGVLYGLARGYDLERCGQLGSIAAEEVIRHIGPRPETSLRQLAGKLV